MAREKLGSHPSHGFSVVEQIDSQGRQLDSTDSGKIFMLDQQSDQITINLPPLSPSIAGWQAKFILRTLDSKMSIMCYEMNGGESGGTTGGGGAPETDNPNAGGIMSIVNPTPTPSGAWQASQTHANVTDSDYSYSGNGSGAEFDITTDGDGNPTIIPDAMGEGYLPGEEITITDPGSSSETAIVTINSVKAWPDSKKLTYVEITDTDQSVPRMDGIACSGSADKQGSSLDIMTDGYRWFTMAFGDDGTEWSSVYG